MLTFPNCKINLGLHVIRKRRDGFHAIETVFYPVQWTDALEIIPDKRAGKSKLKLHLHGIPVSGSAESNLCVRAYRLLDADFDLPPVHLHLLKNIPMGAGLGGGSANAAFTIKLLNDQFGLQLSLKQMEDYCRQLGSDCAFFIRNRPVFAYGKGDRFRAVQVNLAGYHLAVVHPGIHVSTADAYAAVPKRGAATEGQLPGLVEKPVTQWKRGLKNDFEVSVLPKHPQIAQLKQQLYDAGAVYASMSGSGSAVFGLFTEAPRLPAKLRQMKNWVGKLK